MLRLHPLVQIGAQEIDDRGVARVEDVVNILLTYSSRKHLRLRTVSGTNPESSGSWFHRTLVLIDGKRLIRQPILIRCQRRHGACTTG